MVKPGLGETLRTLIIFRATMDRMPWEAMIADALKKYNTSKEW